VANRTRGNARSSTCEFAINQFSRNRTTRKIFELAYVLAFSKNTHQITPNKDVTWKDAPQPKELLMAAHRG